jgi:plasmid stabilization system protein ParE
VKPVNHDAEARCDILAAVRFYEERQPGLGERFLRLLDDTVRRVAERPGACGFYDKPPLRSAQVPKFPYRVLFVEDDEAVWIVAVAHLSRKPGWWRHRLER